MCLLFSSPNSQASKEEKRRTLKIPNHVIVQTVKVRLPPRNKSNYINTYQKLGKNIFITIYHIFIRKKSIKNDQFYPLADFINHSEWPISTWFLSRNETCGSHLLEAIHPSTPMILENAAPRRRIFAQLKEIVFESLYCFPILHKFGFYVITLTWRPVGD